MSALLSVANLSFEDADDTAGKIGGGTVQWTPPSTATITSYQVYIAYDTEGQFEAQLWFFDADTDQAGPSFPVGTNQFTILDGTNRRTTNPSYPANWLIVYSLVGTSRQSTADAAKIPLYDSSSSVPPEAAIILDTTGTSLTSGTVHGEVQWAPANQADLGFLVAYAVYVSGSSGGAGVLRHVEDVPVGTNSVVMPGAWKCADSFYVGVYGKNPEGESATAQWAGIQACSGTSTRTTTTTTTTTTSQLGADAVIFMDTNSEANQIGSATIIFASSPDSGTTHYEVYLANDQAGSYKAQLWYEDSTTASPQFPVGTNQFSLYHNTRRQTTNAQYPGNWVLVYRVSASGLESADTAKKTLIYDLSDSVPGTVDLSIHFTDTDDADFQIAGTLSWQPTAQADLGFTTKFEVAMARDTSGSGSIDLGHVPVGTNVLEIPTGTTCWDRRFILVYASNPVGRATEASSHELQGCTTQEETTTTTTTTLTDTTSTATTATTTSHTTSTATTTILTITTTTVTTVPTTTTVNPQTVTDLTLTDTNAAPNQIGGARIRWTPPADTNGILGYEAWIAYDTLASHEAQLWYEDPVSDAAGTDFPAGTNEFYIFSSTPRQTTNANFPALWLLVYSRTAEGRQAAGNAAKVMIYDHTTSVPSMLALDVTFADLDPSVDRIAGTLSWAAPAQSDTAFATYYAVYLAADALGTGEESLQTIPVGTNHFEIPSGTYCWDKGYVLVYMGNPNGLSSEASSAALDGCNNPAPTTTTTYTTGATLTTSTDTTETTGPAEGSTTASKTTTVTTTAGTTAISSLTFLDVNNEAGQIGGAIVEWTPPSDTTLFTHYEVFIAYDALGSHQAQLWYSNPSTGASGPDFPLGTNHFTLYEPTTRRTVNAAYPANWLIVYLAGSSTQAAADAVKVPLYDASGLLPSSVLFTLDTSGVQQQDGELVGTVQWTVTTAQADLGYIQTLGLHVSSDDSGSGAAPLQAGTLTDSTILLPTGHSCDAGGYVALFMINPNGESRASPWVPFEACLPTTSTTTLTVTTATETLQTATTVQVTTTVAVAAAPTAITELRFTDTNNEANRLSGIVEWTPPSQMSGVSSFRVYIAHDVNGLNRARLWYYVSDEDFGIDFAVGTNRFSIYPNTQRSTTSSDSPANWLLVHTVSEGTEQAVADAAKTPLYDATIEPPANVILTLDTSGSSLDGSEIVGQVLWTAVAQVDLGFTQKLVLHLAQDEAGTGEVLLSSASLDTSSFDIPPGWTCAAGSHVGVYATNPNGQILASSWVQLAACEPTTSTTTSSTNTMTTATVTVPIVGPITTTATTSTASDVVNSKSVRDLTFTDTNPEAFEIGGSTVEWSPPEDIVGTTHFMAFIAYDEQGVGEAKLWWQDVQGSDEFFDQFPVGTNRFQLFHSTKRQTELKVYPANWLIVYAVTAGTRQDVTEAARVQLYDESSTVPPDQPLELTFVDADPRNESINGTLRWQSPALTDFAFFLEYEVCLARNATGLDLECILTVPRTVQEVNIDVATTCWDRDHLLVYVRNPHGRSARPSSWSLTGCDVPAPTTSTTSETSTSSTSTSTTTTWTTTTASTSTASTQTSSTATAAAGVLEATSSSTTSATATHTSVTTTTTNTVVRLRVSDLSFTDTNPQANDIGGAVIQWTPPEISSDIDRYQVYLSYDDSGLYRVRLWYTDPQTEDISMDFPVGTNHFDIIRLDPTRRQTSADSYPANFVMVYPVRGGVEQAISQAASARIYDLSTGIPGDLALSLDFSDLDSSDAGITGPLQWTLPAPVDLGFTTSFSVYLARDPAGSGETFLLDVQVGTNAVWIQNGTACWDNQYLLVYQSNPNGKSSLASSLQLDGCTTPSGSDTSTTSAASDTVSDLVSTTAEFTISNLQFVDTNVEAYQIGGSVITWDPPAGATQYTHYEASIAYDASGQFEARLWHRDAGTGEIGTTVPVGTNEFRLVPNTGRRSNEDTYPANWLLVFMANSEGRQEASLAQKLLIYDLASGTPPSATAVATLAFSSAGESHLTFGGPLNWVLQDKADTGFITEWVVCQAEDLQGTNKAILGNVSVGTHEMVIPTGTNCSLGPHLLLYAKNPQGLAEEPAGTLFDVCLTSTTTTTATTSSATTVTTTMSTTTSTTTTGSTTSTSTRTFTTTTQTITTSTFTGTRTTTTTQTLTSTSSTTWTTTNTATATATSTLTTSSSTSGTLTTTLSTSTTATHTTTTASTSTFTGPSTTSTITSTSLSTSSSSTTSTSTDTVTGTATGTGTGTGTGTATGSATSTHTATATSTSTATSTATLAALAMADTSSATTTSVTAITATTTSSSTRTTTITSSTATVTGTSKTSTATTLTFTGPTTSATTATATATSATTTTSSTRTTATTTTTATLTATTTATSTTSTATTITFTGPTTSATTATATATTASTTSSSTTTTATSTVTITATATGTSTTSTATTLTFTGPTTSATTTSITATTATTTSSSSTTTATTTASRPITATTTSSSTTTTTTATATSTSTATSTTWTATTLTFTGPTTSVTTVSVTATTATTTSSSTATTTATVTGTSTTWTATTLTFTGPTTSATTHTATHTLTSTTSTSNTATVTSTATTTVTTTFTSTTRTFTGPTSTATTATSTATTATSTATTPSATGTGTTATATTTSATRTHTSSSSSSTTSSRSISTTTSSTASNTSTTTSSTTALQLLSTASNTSTTTSSTSSSMTAALSASTTTITVTLTIAATATSTATVSWPVTACPQSSADCEQFMNNTQVCYPDCPSDEASINPLTCRYDKDGRGYLTGFALCVNLNQPHELSQVSFVWGVYEVWIQAAGTTNITSDILLAAMLQAVNTTEETVAVWDVTTLGKLATTSSNPGTANIGSQDGQRRLTVSVNASGDYERFQVVYKILATVVAAPELKSRIQALVGSLGAERRSFDSVVLQRTGGLVITFLDIAIPIIDSFSLLRERGAPIESTGSSTVVLATSLASAALLLLLWACCCLWCFTSSLQRRRQEERESLLSYDMQKDLKGLVLGLPGADHDENPTKFGPPGRVSTRFQTYPRLGPQEPVSAPQLHSRWAAPSRALGRLPRPRRPQGAELLPHPGTTQFQRPRRSLKVALRMLDPPRQPSRSRGAPTCFAAFSDGDPGDSQLVGEDGDFGSERPSARPSPQPTSMLCHEPIPEEEDDESDDDNESTSQFDAAPVARPSPQPAKMLWREGGRRQHLPLWQLPSSLAQLEGDQDDRLSNSGTSVDTLVLNTRASPAPPRMLAALPPLPATPKWDAATPSLSTSPLSSRHALSQSATPSGQSQARSPGVISPMSSGSRRPSDHQVPLSTIQEGLWESRGSDQASDQRELRRLLADMDDVDAVPDYPSSVHTSPLPPNMMFGGAFGDVESRLRNSRNLATDFWESQSSHPLASPWRSVSNSPWPSVGDNSESLAHQSMSIRPPQDFLSEERPPARLVVVAEHMREEPCIRSSWAARQGANRPEEAPFVLPTTPGRKAESSLDPMDEEDTYSFPEDGWEDTDDGSLSLTGQGGLSPAVVLHCR